MRGNWGYSFEGLVNKNPIIESVNRSKLYPEEKDMAKIYLLYESCTWYTYRWIGQFLEIDPNRVYKLYRKMDKILLEDWRVVEEFKLIKERLKEGNELLHNRSETMQVQR